VNSAGHPNETSRLVGTGQPARAGHEELPATFPAADQAGTARDAVGPGQFDPEQRRDRPPWFPDMIVRADRRRPPAPGTLAQPG